MYYLFRYCASCLKVVFNKIKPSFLSLIFFLLFLDKTLYRAFVCPNSSSAVSDGRKFTLKSITFYNLAGKSNGKLHVKVCIINNDVKRDLTTKVLFKTNIELEKS